MQIPESSRHELKMATNDLMLPNVQSWLRVRPAGFYASHPKRQVNNAYFDTPHLASFVEHLSGVTARRKVRLRWYGDDTTNVKGVFEVKRKRNLHGWKLSKPLTKRLNLSSLKWVEINAAIRDELTDDLRIYLDSANFPMLIDRYWREYYLSSPAQQHPALGKCLCGDLFRGGHGIGDSRSKPGCHSDDTQ